MIDKIEGGYIASVTPPHGDGTAWSAAEPMDRDQLVKALRQLDCHRTDIGDAFYAADPDPMWLD